MIVSIRSKTWYIYVGALMFAFYGAAKGAATDPDDVDITPAETASTHFWGFGVEWDSHAHGHYELDDHEYSLIEDRIAWMRLPVARVMMLCKWCCLEDGTYDFETAEMNRLYLLLDILQQQGTTVILTDWGVGLEWMKAEGIRKAAAPQYARAIAVYLNHLLKIKGYHCIRSFVIGNEPDLEILDYMFWKQAVRSVHSELLRTGFHK